jgi:hypothetical protein
VTPPGIDPETVRLVAQSLKNYATPGRFVYEEGGKIHKEELPKLQLM